MVLYLKWSEIGITLRKSQTPRGSVNKGRDVCEASRTGRGVNSQGQVSLPRMLFPALRLLPGAAPPPLLPFGVQELRLPCGRPLSPTGDHVFILFIVRSTRLNDRAPSENISP